MQVVEADRISLLDFHQLKCRDIALAAACGDEFIADRFENTSGDEAIPRRFKFGTPGQLTDLQAAGGNYLFMGIVVDALQVNAFNRPFGRNGAAGSRFLRRPGLRESAGCRQHQNNQKPLHI